MGDEEVKHIIRDGKVIKDGEVALLISHGYGAGWSTWNHKFPECLTDPEVVTMLILGSTPRDIEQFVEDKYGHEFYSGGADGLTIVWVPEGSKYFIIEQDGSETLLTENMLRTA